MQREPRLTGSRILVNFRWRILLSILAVNFFLILTLVSNRVLLTKHFIHEREDNAINKFGILLSREVGKAAGRADTAEIRNILSAADSQVNIEFVAVSDSSGRVLFCSDRRMEGTVRRFARNIPIREAEGDVLERDFFNGPCFIHIGYSLRGVHNDIRQMWRWSIGLSSLLILATLFIAFIMQRWLSAAMASLAAKNRELEETNRKLRELDRLKSDFVSMVSHDLRTPLTSIIGFSKTLQVLPLPAEQQGRYLKIIEDEGKRLSGLIEEYLDVSKMEAGKLMIRMEPLDIPALLQETLRIVAVPPGLSLTHSVSGDMRGVSGDPARLKRAILNLLDNAFRYSPRGGAVTVSAAARAPWIEISVSDQGPGVRPEDRERIFEKFFRGGDPLSENSRGSGLGLAIVRGIAEAHGGRARVEAAAGGGARFVVEIPLKGDVS